MPTFLSSVFGDFGTRLQSEQIEGASRISQGARGVPVTVMWLVQRLELETMVKVSKQAPLCHQGMRFDLAGTINKTEAERAPIEKTAKLSQQGGEHDRRMNHMKETATPSEKEWWKHTLECEELLQMMKETWPSKWRDGDKSWTVVTITSFRTPCLLHHLQKFPLKTCATRALCNTFELRSEDMLHTTRSD